jgi:hypothetical protein
MLKKKRRTQPTREYYRWTTEQYLPEEAAVKLDEGEVRQAG